MFQTALSRYAKTSLAISSIALLLGISACGGGGNKTPTLDPIPDLVLVANRTMPTTRVTATDLDSTLLYYTTAGYTENEIKLRELLGWPRNGPLIDLGLSLNKVTGLISGTPNTLGKFPITIIVTDSEGASDSKKFSVEIIPESLNAQFVAREENGVKINELLLVATDTSRAGTVAYCITTNAETPRPSDPCFRSDAEGGRTVTVPVTFTTKLPRYYLFTKSANNNVLGGAAPTVGNKPLVLIDTNKGAFVVELEADKAKITVDNFLQYIESGFFNNTVFHRIMSNFVIQGGGYVYQPDDTTKYRAKTEDDGLKNPIALEKTSATGLSNTKGTIAMARTNAANSATSQFFINVVDNVEALDAGKANSDGYAVFGRVLPPQGGVAGDLPPAVLELLKTPVSGALGGGTEASLPVGEPPFIVRAGRIN